MRRLFRFFSSLRLTVALLAFSMALVLLATFEQQQWGVYEVQKRYFATLLAWWTYPEQWPNAASLQWLKIPLPGGFLLGGMLLVNLLCAHFRHFKARWNKIGIALIHGGILLLIVSGFATAYLQEENFMWLPVGGTSDYIESFHDVELALVDHTNPKEDIEVSIPASRLKAGATIQNPALPFTLRVVAYYPNADIFFRGKNEQPETGKADQGIAAHGFTLKDGTTQYLGLAPLPFDYADDAKNLAGAFVAVDIPGGGGGTWMVSTMFNGPEAPPIMAGQMPQTFKVAGHTWEITLRPRREYLPYSLHLDTFIHEKYPGTEVPKRYESQVHLINPSLNENRPVLIYMNHPLRYQGLTFYQASFAQGDQFSMLQVVRNPGWLLPYFAVAIVGLGLLLHFAISLWLHLRTEARKTTAGPPTPSAGTGSPAPSTAVREPQSVATTRTQTP